MQQNSDRNCSLRQRSSWAGEVRTSRLPRRLKRRVYKPTRVTGTNAVICEVTKKSGAIDVSADRCSHGANQRSSKPRRLQKEGRRGPSCLTFPTSSSGSSIFERFQAFLASLHPRPPRFDVPAHVLFGGDTETLRRRSWPAARYSTVGPWSRSTSMQALVRS